MTNKDRIWKYVGKSLSTLLEVKRSQEEIADFLGVDYDSRIMRDNCKLFDVIVENLSLLVGDECDSIGWYVWDNDFGRKGLEAGIEGDMRKIQTLEDLRWYIELEGEEK